MGDDFDPHDHKEGHRFFRGVGIALAITVVAVIVAAVLSACTPTYTGPAISERTIVLHLSSAERIQHVANSRTSKATTRWSRADGTQEIWMKPPTSPEDFEFMCSFFHEGLHYEIGQWHGERPEDDCAPREHW